MIYQAGLNGRLPFNSDSLIMPLKCISSPFEVCSQKQLHLVIQHMPQMPTEIQEVFFVEGKLFNVCGVWEYIISTQRMFSNISQQQPSGTGKRITGLPYRRGDEFSLNWEQTNQMSNYQMRKSKNREITGKITTQAIIQNRELPRQPPTQKDYERIFYENPDMSHEELEKMMHQYDQYRGGVPSRSSKAEQSENREGERRTPIRPRESMKDIIYNGVGEENPKAGHRNNSNFKADSYNYYQGGRN